MSVPPNRRNVIRDNIMRERPPPLAFVREHSVPPTSYTTYTSAENSTRPSWRLKKLFTHARARARGQSDEIGNRERNGRGDDDVDEKVVRRVVLARVGLKSMLSASSMVFTHFSWGGVIRKSRVVN